MSYSIDKVETVSAVDPRIVDTKTKYIVLTGGESVTQQTYQAETYTNSLVSWAVTTNSPSVFLDRRFMVKMSFSVNIPQTNVKPLDTNGFGPRCLPLSSCCNTVSLTINGEQTSIQLGDMVHALVHYNNTLKCKTGTFSGSAAMPDYYSTYLYAQNTNRNPFENAKDNSAEIPRGAILYDSITGNYNDPGGITFVFTVEEPLLISPLATGCGLSEDALYHVQNFGVTMNLDCSRAWSQIALPANITPVVTVSGVPTLTCTYISRKQIAKIPPVLNYRYEKMQLYTNDIGKIDAGAENKPFTSRNISFPQIPEKLYIYVRRLSLIHI